MTFETEKKMAKEIVIALISNGLLDTVPPEDKIPTVKKAYDEILSMIKAN